MQGGTLDIGLEVKILRERLKISAKELAERIGLSQSQMSRLEKGQRRVDTRVLQKIADALSVEPSYFFRGETAPSGGVIPAALPAEIGKLIRTERRKRHVSAEDLAGRLGLTKAKILSIEEGKRELEPELVERIAKVLRLPASYFLGVQQRTIRQLEAQVSRLHQALAEASRGSVRVDLDTAADREAIPVLGTLSTGYPTVFDALGRPVAEADDFVLLPALQDPQAFALHVVGNSMETAGRPSFHEGDLIIFGSGPLRSRSFAFVRLESEPPTFRQVFFEAAGHVRLQPLNLDLPSHTYPRGEVLALWPLLAHVASF